MTNLEKLIQECENRITNSYRESCNEHLLIQIIKVQNEALNDIEDEWCKHSKLDSFRLKNAGRDFCGHCNAWVYDEEKTTARQALEKVEQIAGRDE